MRVAPDPAVLTRHRLNALLQGRVYHQFAQMKMQPQMQMQTQPSLMQPLIRARDLNRQRSPPPSFALAATISQPSYQWQAPRATGYAQDPVPLPAQGPGLGREHSLTQPFLPVTTQGQDRAAQLSVSDAGPGPITESTDLLGLALLPPRSSAPAVSDLCQTRDRLRDTEDATPLASRVAADHAARGGAAAAPAAPAAPAPGGTSSMISLPLSGQKKVVYVDLPSRSVFTRSVLP